MAAENQEDDLYNCEICNIKFETAKVYSEMFLLLKIIGNKFIVYLFITFIRFYVIFLIIEINKC